MSRINTYYSNAHSVWTDVTWTGLNTDHTLQGMLLPTLHCSWLGEPDQNNLNETKLNNEHTSWLNNETENSKQ